jgi:hypothetical protein
MTGDPDQVSARLASRINWGEVHRRLERAQAALEQRTTLTADEMKVILKARAKALAPEQEADQCEQDRLEVIEFVLADEKYAVESSFVREVCPFKDHFRCRPEEVFRPAGKRTARPQESHSHQRWRDGVWPLGRYCYGFAAYLAPGSAGNAANPDRRAKRIPQGSHGCARGGPGFGEAAVGRTYACRPEERAMSLYPE